MSTLMHLNQRLRSTENIRQITKSMEMIASVRFRKAHAQAKSSSYYCEKLEEILDSTSLHLQEASSPFFVHSKPTRCAVVLVSSDRGLCGGYNSALFHHAEHFLASRKELDPILHLIGKKALLYFAKKKWAMGLKLQEKNNFNYINPLLAELVRSFLSATVQHIFLIYTTCRSLMSREVVVEQLLPINGTEKKKEHLLFEPDAGSFAEKIAHRYLKTKLETMAYMAKSAELAARIFAMKAASQNAEEMIDHLMLERNKIRQALITREIIETARPIEEGYE